MQATALAAGALEAAAHQPQQHVAAESAAAARTSVEAQMTAN